MAKENSSKTSSRWFIRLSVCGKFEYFSDKAFSNDWSKSKPFTTELAAQAAAEKAGFSVAHYDPARGTIVDGEIHILLLIPHRKGKG